MAAGYYQGTAGGLVVIIGIGTSTACELFYASALNSFVEPEVVEPESITVSFYGISLSWAGITACLPRINLRRLPDHFL